MSHLHRDITAFNWCLVLGLLLSNDLWLYTVVIAYVFVVMHVRLSVRTASSASFHCCWSHHCHRSCNAKHWCYVYRYIFNTVLQLNIRMHSTRLCSYPYVCAFSPMLFKLWRSDLEVTCTEKIFGWIASASWIHYRLIITGTLYFFLKTTPLIFVFFVISIGKYTAIFEIAFPENFYDVFHLTLTVLLLYLAKFTNVK